MKTAVKKRTSLFGIPLFCGITVILLFRFILIFGVVPSESMEPTISAGSFILGTRIYGELSRGDVVIFRRAEKMLIKRVAAIPGDALDEGAAVLIVPEGCYYLLGDNPGESLDSRYWGNPFVHKRDVLGRLLLP